MKKIHFMSFLFNNYRTEISFRKLFYNNDYKLIDKRTTIKQLKNHSIQNLPLQKEVKPTKTKFKERSMIT